MPPQIGTAVARRFLAIRHLLAPPRALPGTPESVLAAVDRLGSLQFDPLEVAGRNHDLVLHARVAGYRRELTDELLYGRRLLFEAYNKSLNLLPTRELPYYRISWETAAAGRSGELLAGAGPTGGEGPGDDRGRRTQDARPTSSERGDHRLVVGAHLRGPGGAGGPQRVRPAGPGPTRRQPPLLRPDRAALPGRSPGDTRPGARAAAPQAAVPVPCPRPAGRRRERRAVARHRAGGATGASCEHELVDRGELVAVAVEGLKGQRFVVADELPLLAQAEREIAAEGSWGRASPRRRRPLVAASSPRSTRSCGTATRSCRSTASTTAGRSTRRRRSAAGATTSCRSCSATGWWAGSSHASIAARKTVRVLGICVGGGLRSPRGARLRARLRGRPECLPRIRRGRHPGTRPRSLAPPAVRRPVGPRPGPPRLRPARAEAAPHRPRIALLRPEPDRPGGRPVRPRVPRIAGQRANIPPSRTAGGIEMAVVRRASVNWEGNLASGSGRL